MDTNGALLGFYGSRGNSNMAVASTSVQRHCTIEEQQPREQQFSTQELLLSLINQNKQLINTVTLVQKEMGTLRSDLDAVKDNLLQETQRTVKGSRSVKLDSKLKVSKNRCIVAMV